jgi:hypothetical protein
MVYDLLLKFRVTNCFFWEFSDNLNERLEQILFPWCKFTTVFVNNEKKVHFL